MSNGPLEWSNGLLEWSNRLLEWSNDLLEWSNRLLDHSNGLLEWSNGHLEWFNGQLGKAPRTIFPYSKKIYDDAVSVGVGAIVANYADLSHLTSQLDFQSLRN